MNKKNGMDEREERWGKNKLKMEVKPTIKKTKKLAMTSKKKESYLPAIERETLCYGKSKEDLETRLSPLQQRFGRYACVRVLLPNFRYKKDKFYFYMKNPYDMSYGDFLLKEICQINHFMVKTDLPGISTIQVHYELMKEEHQNGLLCKIYMENPRDYGKKDFQGLCKMIEMTILNMNPTKTYEFIAYQDVYKSEGEYPHIYEEYEQEDEEDRRKTTSYYFNEDEKYDYTENQENEEFNSQWI